MKTLSVIRCNGCRRFLEITEADIQHDVWRTRVRCHKCRSMNLLRRDFAEEMFLGKEPSDAAQEGKQPEDRQPEHPGAEEVGKEAVPSSGDRPQDRGEEPQQGPPQEAIEAYLAYLEYGENYTAAAPSLGVSVQTVRNRVAKLTEQQKNELKTAGKVPAEAASGVTDV